MRSTQRERVIKRCQRQANSLLMNDDFAGIWRLRPRQQTQFHSPAHRTSRRSVPSVPATLVAVRVKGVVVAPQVGQRVAQDPRLRFRQLHLIFITEAGRGALVSGVGDVGSD